MVNFKILQNNIRGYFNKQQQIEMNILPRESQPHIFAIQGAFRSVKSVQSFQFHAAFNYAFSETGRAGFLYRSDINASEIIFNKNLNKYNEYGYESCWLKVEWPQHKPIMMCSFYRNGSYSTISSQPNSHSFCLPKFQDEYNQASKISNHIITCGDINAHNPAWLDDKVDQVGKDFLDFIFNNDLNILNNHPYKNTRIVQHPDKPVEQSSIDVSLVSQSLADCCVNWKTDDDYDVDSDHLPISFDLQLSEADDQTASNQRYSWNLKNGDWDKFQYRLDTNLYDWFMTLPEEKTENKFEESAKHLTGCIISAANECIGKTLYHPGKNKWFTWKLFRLRKKVRKLKKLFRRRPSFENHSKYKEKHKEFKREIRSRKHEYSKIIIESLDIKQSRGMFKKFKNINGNKIVTIPCLTHCMSNGEKIDANNNEDKANLLNECFSRPP